MDINTIIYLENEMDQSPGGGSIIIINDTYSLYEDETVTASVGTYSKTAVIEDGTATIKGFTETGTVTVSVSDFTTTFNIDKYSKYEVGVVSVGGFYVQWLDSIDESSASYSSLADVLADEEMVRELFTRHASVDFLVSKVGNYPEELETIINNDYCAKWINLRDYALDTLYADSNIASLMDSADKYFYGEWTIVDNTTTPPTWGAKGNVPVMTSNTAPYGECIFSTEYNTTDYRAYKAFDDDINTIWAGTNNSFPTYIGYKFTSPVCCKQIKLIPGGYGGVYYSSYEVKIQASNDNSNWTTLQTVTVDNSERHKVNVFDISNENLYLYYRVLFESAVASSGAVNLASLQFYGRELKVSVPTMTSNTTPYGEASASLVLGSDYAWKAFDNDTSTFWYADSATNTEDYVEFDFKHNYRILEMSVYTKTPSGTYVMPYEGRFEYYDGTDWHIYGETYSKSYALRETYTFTQQQDVIANKLRFYSKNKASHTGSLCVYTFNIYGLDYSEYDWDEDNPRHYIYDHGVELEEIENNEVTIKQSDSILYKKSTSQSSLLHAIGCTSSTIDLTNYSIYRSIFGKKAYNSSTSGTGTISLLITTTKTSDTSNVGYRDIPTSDMPYSPYLDISSINGEKYASFGWGENKDINWEFAELWLE